MTSAAQCDAPQDVYYRQIRIFVPPELDPSCWVETVLGRVVKPVIGEFKPEWFWFSRYEEYEKQSQTDCDLSLIPASFRSEDIYRSVRFRVCVAVDTRQALEERTLELMSEAGYCASGFLDYAYIDDLAQPRFLGEPRTDERLVRRADLHARFLDATSRVFLDALLGPDEDGCYRVEENDCYGSSFSAMRHLFCNMTNAPTPVWVDENEVAQPNPSGEVVILVKPGRILKKL